MEKLFLLIALASVLFAETYEYYSEIAERIANRDDIQEAIHFETESKLEMPEWGSYCLPPKNDDNVPIAISSAPLLSVRQSEDVWNKPRVFFMIDNLVVLVISNDYNVYISTSADGKKYQIYRAKEE